MGTCTTEWGAEGSSQPEFLFLCVLFCESVVPSTPVGCSGQPDRDGRM